MSFGYCVPLNWQIFVGIIFSVPEPILENSTEKSSSVVSKHFKDDTLPNATTLIPDLLLSLITEINSNVYRDLTWMMSIRIGLDLFDLTELALGMEVIIKGNEVSHEVTKCFEKGTLAFA